MIKLLKRLFGKNKNNMPIIKVETPRVIPLISCCKYRTGMSDEALRRNLIRNLEDQLIDLIEIKEISEPDGVTLLKARIDVLVRQEIDIE